MHWDLFGLHIGSSSKTAAKCQLLKTPDLYVICMHLWWSMRSKLTIAGQLSYFQSIDQIPSSLWKKDILCLKCLCFKVTKLFFIFPKFPMTCNHFIRFQSPSPLHLEIRTNWKGHRWLQNLSKKSFSVPVSIKNIE